MIRKQLRRISFISLVFLLLASSIPAMGGGVALAGAGEGALVQGLGTSAEGPYFRIKNKYKDTMYLYASEGKVAYGTPVETDRASHWLIEEQDGKQRLKNRQTGTYMSVANWEYHLSPVELLPVSEPEASAQWVITDALTDGLPNGHKWIQSAMDATHYLHIEDNIGYAQSSSIPPEWGTPQWTFEPVVEYVRLKNSYRNNYLFATDGKVSYGLPDEADPASHWVIEDHEGKQRIKNRLTGTYISVANWEGHLSPLELHPADASPSTSAWNMLDAVTLGLKVFQREADGELHYIHIEDQTGYAQSSSIPPDWGTVQWALEPVTVTVPYDPEPDNDKGPEYIRIKNAWLDLYLYEEEGLLKYGNAAATDHAGHWLIEDEGEIQRIRNRATGHYISWAGVFSDKTGVPVVETALNEETEQWVIENLHTSGAKYIRAKMDEDRLLNVENKLGFVQYGVIPREWTSPKWLFSPVDESERYVRLKNAYRGTYLYEDNGLVRYGDPDYEDAASHWLLEDAGGGLKRILNRKTGHYMNIEGMQGGPDPHLLPLRSSAVEESWTSAKWKVSVTDHVYVFSNAWMTDQRIHVEDETGYAQSSNIPEFWGSAQWILEDVPAMLPPEIPDGYVRLMNAGTQEYLYENENGIVLYGILDAADARAHWKLEETGTGQYIIVNRATGHLITNESQESFLESKPITDIGLAEQWFVESAPAAGKILLRSAERPLEYLHILDRVGFLQLGLRSIEAPLTQWVIEVAPADATVPDPAGEDSGVVTSRISHARDIQWVSAEGAAISDHGGVVAAAMDDAAASSVWNVYDENGYQLFRNKHTGRYLVVLDGRVKTEVLQLGAKTPPAFQWRLIERSEQYWLESVAESGKVLQVTGDTVTLAMKGLQPSGGQLLTARPMLMDVVFEGEDAFLAGGAAVGKDVRGYHGEGYADLKSSEAYMIFAVYAETAGDYQVVLRYANGSATAKELAVAVNGLSQGHLQLAKGANWDDWQQVNAELKLRKGLNTVELSVANGDSTSIFIDQLIVKDTIPPVYRGATVDYERLEAEHAVTNAQVLGPDRTYLQPASEASNRQAVLLEQPGDYVEFTLSRPANRLTLRYSIPDSADGSGLESPIGLYTNGKQQSGAILTSRYAWVYGSYPWTNRPEDGNAHRFYDETTFTVGPLEAGSVIRFQFESDTIAEYVIIDLLEAAWAEDPYEMPQGFISITEYGAVADDQLDDTDAILQAIAAAKSQGQGVWIPAGEFRVDQGPIEIAEVTIRGAGKWHTTLVGGGFMAMGSNVRVFDLAIDGEVTSRRDEIPESGFDGAYGTGSTIQHVRINHVKTGIWSTAKQLPDETWITTDGLYVAGVQIRNTFADGINFSTGTNHSMAEQNQFRNTGDDGMAMWASGVQSVGNTFRYNTVELPWLSNNIAVYGGKDVRITDNLVTDTIGFGAGISISTRHQPVGFEGIVEVDRNTMIRTGSREHNWPADFGGLFLFADSGIDLSGDIRIRDNLIADSTYQGISFLGESSFSGVVLENNVVDGTGTWGIHASGNIKGDALFGNTIVRGVRVGEWMNGAADFDIQTFEEGFSFLKHPFTVHVDGEPVSALKLEAGMSLEVSIHADGKAISLADAVMKISDDEVADVSHGVITGKKAGKAMLQITADDHTRLLPVQVVDRIAPQWTPDAAVTIQGDVRNGYKVSWPAATDQSGIEMYRISWEHQFQTVTGSAYEFLLTGLDTGTRYRVMIDARDAAGNWAEVPLVAEFTTEGSRSGGVIVPIDPRTGSSNDFIVSLKAIVDEHGNSITEVTLDAERLRLALVNLAETDGLMLAIDLEAEGDTIEAVLPIEAIQESLVLQPNAVLSFRHAGAAYELRLGSIASLLSQPSYDNAEELRILIGKQNQQFITALEEQTGFRFKSDVYEFRITLVKDGKAVPVQAFDGVYVVRSIPVTEDISPQHATGVVFDESLGQWRHVPTLFRTLPDGTTAAEIRSLTNSLYTVIDHFQSFADMQHHWASGSVTVLASKQIIAGKNHEQFAPQDPVTRAEFVMMLSSALGLPLSDAAQFDDVASDAWYFHAVSAAEHYDLVKGFDGGTFRPNDRITREQMAVLLMRAYRFALQQGMNDRGSELDGFQDAEDISAWAAEDMNAAVALGLMQGRGKGILAPKDLSTRAETATMIHNLLVKIEFINES